MKRMFASIIGILLVLGIIATTMIWKETSKTFKAMNENLTIPIANDVVNLKESEPITLLLMGVDARSGDRGRADAMMLMTLNPKRNEGVIVSLPRDLRVPISSTGKMDKLNHAYAYGGEKEAVETISNYLDIEIDHLIVADMQGFQKAVDRLDGVRVDNRFAFESENTLFPKGTQRLNGKEALTYVRMRKEDPRGDFGRQSRQREVVISLSEELRDSMSPWLIRDMMTLSGEHIGTTIGMTDAFSLMNNYHSTLNKMEQFEIEGSAGRGDDGLSYWFANENKVEKLKLRLKELTE